MTTPQFPDANRHASLHHWQKHDTASGAGALRDMGWGRLIFAHTYDDLQAVADTLCAEQKGQRDIALYLRDPHVVLSLAPEQLFLDPSHTYRRTLADWAGPEFQPATFEIAEVAGAADAEAVNKIYAARGMVRVPESFFLSSLEAEDLVHLVAKDKRSGEVLGTVTGVDHAGVFGDPESGSSLWCLAVHPLAQHAGLGLALVEALLQRMQARGRAYVDLSVMYDNEEAIGLYEKLGFVRVPVFCVKKKNSINEPLFVPDASTAALNPYAELIAKEAMRRGIQVDVLDAEEGYLALTYGGRRIVTRESLSELTSAVAMSRCADKRVTSRLLAAEGLRVPRQMTATSEDENLAFLAACGALVVKPAQGEQGRGISVEVRNAAGLKAAVARAAAEAGGLVLLEEYVSGVDLRIVVIGHATVAAAVRRPAQVVGDGRKTVQQLIEKQSRRREAATGGESRIPLDEETARCVLAAGYGLQDVPPASEVIPVRKTANLHTGGTIHDVTEGLHPELAAAAEAATRVLDIPVAGVDLMVPDPAKPEYWVIEVNERPGLANHEPQPTAERFIDLLFPRSCVREAWK